MRDGEKVISLRKKLGLHPYARERDKMENMTKRDFMTAIANGEMTDELKEYAAAEIRKIDAANEARRAKTSKKAAENAPLMDKIYEDILGDEPVTATVVGELMEISTQKASALLRKMVDEGRAAKVDVKIPKKGTQKGYTRI